MLMQTHAYSVPADQRDAHERLTKRLQETLAKLGVTLEVYEQVGPQFNPREEATGRFVQVMRFRDRRQLQSVQAAERADPVAQQLIADFIALIGLEAQRERGTYLPGFYFGVGHPSED